MGTLKKNSEKWYGMEKRQQVALFCIYLVISISFLLPVSAPDAAAQADNVPPTFMVSLPAFSPSTVISVVGKTEGNAAVTLQVNPSTPTNDVNFDMQTTATAAGDFAFAGVRLSQGTNTIELFAKDAAGNTNTITLQTTLDTAKPVVQLKQEIPALLNDTEFAIAGTVNEDVNVTFTVSVETLEGPEVATDGPHSIAAGDFVFTPALQPDKENQFVIQFVDRAGNMVEFQQVILVDVSTPEFIQHNMDALDPSYVQEVVLRGQVSEPGIEIFAFVNGENKATKSYSTSVLDSIKQFGHIASGNIDYHDVADSNGMFEIPVFLTQRITEEERQRERDRIPPQFPQERAGREEREFRTEQRDQYGSTPFRPDREFDNDLKIVAVDRVGNTAFVEGKIRFTKCGFGADWNVDVSQISPAVITPELLRLGIAQFAFTHRYKFQGFNASAASVLPPGPFIRLYELNDEIRHSSAVDPLEVIDQSSIVTQCDESDYQTCYTVVTLNAFNYTQPKLKDIRMKNLTVKVPLQVELNYEVDEFGQRVVRAQRQCWNANLLLDIEVPLDAIPEELLKTSIEVLNETTKLINQILKPLKAVTILTLGSCMTSWALLFFVMAREKFVCEISKLAGKGNEENCRDAKERTIKFERTMKFLCDRTFCPSVPSVSYFMRTNRYQECRAYSIYDFSKYNEDKAKEEAHAFFKDKRIRDIFGIAEKDRPKYVQEATQGKSPEDICIYDYFEQWDSACILMNELQQSTCMEMQQKCPKGLKGTADRIAGFCGRKVERNETGFCESGRAGVGEHCYYKDVDGNWYLATEVREAEVKDRKVVKVGEIAYDVGRKSDTNTKQGVIGLHHRYAYEKPVFQRISPSKERIIDYHRDAFESMPVACPGLSKNVYRWKHGKDVYVDSATKQTYILINNEKDADRLTGTPTCIAASLDDPEYWDEWHPDEYLLDVDGNTVQWEDVEPGKATPATPPGPVGREYETALHYIVQPSSSFVRALQCVCFPAITGYLNLWKNILEQIKLCFETILLTGQGKTGVCRAVLTTYVCDIILDAVKCFARKYGPSSQRQKPGTPLGGFFSSLAGAGEQIQQDIAGRYGSGNLYKLMFNERKVIHQACLFAFTGDFDLDVEGLLTTGYGVPIRSEGFLYPHTRRFISYNPLDGKANFIYHLGVGLVAGAELTYNVQLVCSNDLSCNPNDGFSGGKCDCYGRDPIVRDITSNFESFGRVGSLPGRLAAGEVLGGEAGDLYIPVADPVRYDKAVLQWTWYDGNQQKIDKVEKSINQIGGKPPAECQFNPQLDFPSFGFRCRTIVDRQGAVRFTEDPRAEKRYFYLNQPIQLQFSLEKQSPGYDPNKPDTSQNQVPKWLCWEVRAKDRKTGSYLIAPDSFGTTNCYKLAVDKAYYETDALFGPEGMPGYRVRAEDFSSGIALTGLRREDVIRPLGIAPTAQCATSRDIVSTGIEPFQDIRAQVQGVSIAGNIPEGAFAIVFADENTYTLFNVQYKENNYCIIPKSAGQVGAGRLQPSAEGQSLTYNGVTVSFSPGYQSRAGDAMVLAHPGTSVTALRTGPGLSCEDFNKQQTAADWVVQVRVYDAKPIQRDKDVSLQNAVMDETKIVSDKGRKLELEVPIKAVCSEPPEGTEEERGCVYHSQVIDPDGCFCESKESGGRRLCPRGNYCVKDALLHPDAQCTEYKICPGPNTVLTAENTVEGYCDCIGNDGIMEYCGIEGQGGRQRYCVGEYLDRYGNKVERTTGCSDNSKSDLDRTGQASRGVGIS